ncbi:hypothetical protein UFOVP901_56 [uncultured Caudovirales phage]|uniref:Uncharacterized protein n=1 Tax=uncultured Caudovirales phage TaxID=2100421 RepID=A0A6J5PFK0_9CAUD|nr:hypothetical protein UFOVP901_56 [uncultured Caudovirales phage]
MTKADTNRNFIASKDYRDNFDKIFYVQEEGVVEDSNTTLEDNINDKRIYQKDNSHGSDFKEDI